MIRRNLVSLTLSAALALFASAGSVYAQDAESVEPFKVGTFAIDDVPTVGLVMRDDQLIVELTAANRAMELLPQYASMLMPADMLGLIEQYEYGLKYRIYEVVNWLNEEGLWNPETSLITSIRSLTSISWRPFNTPAKS